MWILTRGKHVYCTVCDGLSVQGSLEEWLRLLRLEEYGPCLVSQGYSSVQEVATISIEDLEVRARSYLVQQLELFFTGHWILPPGPPEETHTGHPETEGGVQTGPRLLPARPAASLHQPGGAQPGGGWGEWGAGSQVGTVLLLPPAGGQLQLPLQLPEGGDGGAPPPPPARPHGECGECGECGGAGADGPPAVPAIQAVPGRGGPAVPARLPEVHTEGCGRSGPPATAAVSVQDDEVIWRRRHCQEVRQLHPAPRGRELQASHGRGDSAQAEDGNLETQTGGQDHRQHQEQRHTQPGGHWQGLGGGPGLSHGREQCKVNYITTLSFRNWRKYKSVITSAPQGPLRPTWAWGRRGVGQTPAYRPSFR